jgi:peptidoglycan/xylan/chitin deacetylase (PgdA/CDA1 family)
LENEEDAIIKTINSIEAFSGTRPVSWESPGLTETSKTLHLLRKHGVTNIADWVIDDLPCNVETDFGTVTTIPYTVEMNDIAIYALQNHSSEEILHRGKLQFDRLYSEGEENARIMAISIHPYITGVPHRIAALEALFDYIIDHDDVEWMTAKEIGDWFNKQHNNP